MFGDGDIGSLMLQLAPDLGDHVFGTELPKHQSRADKLGVGELWKDMIDRRTRASCQTVIDALRGIDRTKVDGSAMYAQAGLMGDADMAKNLCLK